MWQRGEKEGKSPQRGETFKPRVKPWVLNVPKTPNPLSFPVPINRKDRTFRSGDGGQRWGRGVGGWNDIIPGVSRQYCRTFGTPG